jgi:hypothetical protein
MTRTRSGVYGNCWEHVLKGLSHEEMLELLRRKERERLAGTARCK